MGTKPKIAIPDELLENLSKTVLYLIDDFRYTHEQFSSDPADKLIEPGSIRRCRKAMLAVEKAADEERQKNGSKPYQLGKDDGANGRLYDPRRTFSPRETLEYQQGFEDAREEKRRSKPKK